jgi:hypothetical protein
LRIISLCVATIFSNWATRSSNDPVVMPAS